MYMYMYIYIHTCTCTCTKLHIVAYWVFEQAIAYQNSVTRVHVQINACVQLCTMYSYMLVIYIFSCAFIA